MVLWRTSVLFVVIALLLARPAPRVRAAASIELYGTFHAMGIIVSVDPGDDPDGDATASVEYRAGGEGSYRQGFPLARIADTRFVGSLFWLSPDTDYGVRVHMSDPDGGSLDGVTVTASAATRAEITFPSPAQSYHVSPSGSGTACSVGVPCGLAFGLDQAQPGDEVVLRGGVYYQGEVALPRSGSPGAPIVIRGYDGEDANLGTLCDCIRSKCLNSDLEARRFDGCWSGSRAGWKHGCERQLSHISAVGDQAHLTGLSARSVSLEYHILANILYEEVNSE